MVDLVLWVCVWFDIGFWFEMVVVKVEWGFLWYLLIGIVVGGV